MPSHRPLLRRPARRAGRHGLLLAVLLLAATSASADRLVTHDGVAIETRGPWEVRDALVVFTLPNGQLSSMRLSEIDLEASRAATEAAARPQPETEKPEAEEPPRRAVLVLTDRDVSHVDVPPLVRRGVEEAGSRPGTEDSAAGRAAASGPGAAEGGSPRGSLPPPPPVPAAASNPSAAVGAGGRISIADWEEESGPSTRGVIFAGEIANSSDDTVGNIQLTVELRDSTGELLGRRSARLTSSILGPGATARFRADFQDIYVYDDVSFEFDGFALETGDQAPSGIGEGGG